MNTELLNGIIVASGVKKAAIMEALGCTTYDTLNRKLNGESELTLREIAGLRKLLHISKAQSEKIFFGDYVAK